MYNYGTWRLSGEKSKNPLAEFIDKEMRQLLLANPYTLPNLHSSSTIFIFSDYSGEHAEADYQTISLIITDGQAIGEWEPYRIQVRKRYLSDGRRMSFKQLRDQRRWQGLPSFLTAAENLRGLAATIGIHTSIPTLFSDSSPLDLHNPEFAKFAHWSQKTLEKLFRIIHFNSIFLAGMSRQGQNIMWITDDDSIAPNVQRLTELTELFAIIASQYLSHNLGHLRVGILSMVDSEERRLEDLVAIPDLISGAVSEILTLQMGSDELVFDVPPSVYLSPERFSPKLIRPQSKSFGVYQRGSQEILSKQASMSVKTAFILNWLGNSNQELRKIALVIDPSPINSEQLLFRWLKFHSYEETHH